ncbi:MAG: type II pantothenate kinase [Clostridia bacterium]|nr:type II pantothenate kinase [Clostridia bacterium]
MNVIIGIDVGGSTTKIVGFSESGQLIEPMFVHADDQVTSIFGAFGKFTDTNDISLDQIQKVMVTGVGSTYLDKGIYGLKCERVPEFDCVAAGGLYLSGLDRAVITSLGTGTACVYAERNGNMEYMGGTGVGGGTLMGLSKLILGMDNINNIAALAENGNPDKIDLRIKDITNNVSSGVKMESELTASNFGKISDIAEKSDIALGIINMVFETVGTLSIFASKNHGKCDIVLTGNLTTLPQAQPIFKNIGDLLGASFIIPQYSQFGTVIGAALLGHVS